MTICCTNSISRDHELREGVLYIESLQASDLGEYVCLASNYKGSVQSVISLEAGSKCFKWKMLENMELFP